MAKFENIVNHLITSGYIYRGSEIYGGLANTWDFGPLGVELKNNIKKLWWQKFINESTHNVGVDTPIIINTNIWKASGHLGNFTDPLMDCKNCKARHRADKLLEDSGIIDINGFSNDQLYEKITKEKIVCPKCGSHDFTPIRNFNLMFKTNIGVIEDALSAVYLRPETAQGIFVNFKNIQRTTRRKIPFGVGQIGKSFRNEITPGNFIFRLREFEQAELEFFCVPGTDLQWYQYYKDFCFNFLLSLNIKKDNLRIREHTKEELSHYSKGTSDIEYLFPFGWGEIWGIADRGDYDLSAHSKASGEKLDYIDPINNSRYTPYCVEPSVGIERLFLTAICDAYEEEQLADDVRIVLKLHPALSPVKLAVFPLDKRVSVGAQEIYQNLIKHFACEFDEAGSIGKRYRRQDAAGTPFCLTYDHDSLTDGKVTIRFRDDMSQVRMAIEEVRGFIESRIKI